MVLINFLSFTDKLGAISKEISHALYHHLAAHPCLHPSPLCSFLLQGTTTTKSCVSIKTNSFIYVLTPFPLTNSRISYNCHLGLSHHWFFKSPLPSGHFIIMKVCCNILFLRKEDNKERNLFMDPGWCSAKIRWYYHAECYSIEILLDLLGSTHYPELPKYPLSLP